MRSLTLPIGLLAVLAATGLGAQSNPDAAARAASARVREGDKVTVHFLREPDLSGEVTVNERGEASFPKLGSLRVAEMSISQLQDTLRARYGAYFRSPEFEVNVLRRLVVNGEVKTPDVYMIDLASSVRDAIALAGGIIETGDRRKVYIVRDGNRILVKDWETAIGAGSDLRSGDQLLVGRRSWWAINALPATSTLVLVASLLISVSR